MRYVKFKVVSDDDFGQAGILPNIFKNWENYSPAIAVGALGHDLIEHGTRETGAFYQEVAAHGSFLYGRVLSGYGYYGVLTTHKRLVSNFASDWEASTTQNIPTPKAIDKETSVMLDEVFVGLREEAIKNWEAETWGTFGEEDEDRDCPYTTEENWPKIIGWLKYGYARAQRRYKEDYIAYRLVNEIQKVIEREWPWLQEYEGSDREFTLEIDIENAEVRLREQE